MDKSLQKASLIVFYLGDVKSQQEELLAQWEPKVQKMASRASIIGLDREDICQELRMVVLKAAGMYKQNSKSSFHTYLHTAMFNRTGHLIHKQRKLLGLYSLDKLAETTTNEIGKIDDEYVCSDYDVEINKICSCDDERTIIEMRMHGFTWKSIHDELSHLNNEEFSNCKKRIRDGFIGIELIPRPKDKE